MYEGFSLAAVTPFFKSYGPGYLNFISLTSDVYKPGDLQKANAGSSGFLQFLRMLNTPKKMVYTSIYVESRIYTFNQNPSMPTLVQCLDAEISSQIISAIKSNSDLTVSCGSNVWTYLSRSSYINGPSKVGKNPGLESDSRVLCVNCGTPMSCLGSSAEDSVNKIPARFVFGADGICLDSTYKMPIRTALRLSVAQQVFVPATVPVISSVNITAGRTNLTAVC